MRPAVRFLLPVGLALVLGASVIGVLSWQVNLSAEKLRAQISNSDLPITTSVQMSPDAPSDADSGDEALLNLRKGDLLALQKDWAGAESAYRDAVDNGGGMTAAKKLAQVFIQRGKYDDASIAINDLQAKGMRPEDVLLLQSIILLNTGKTPDALAMLTDAPDSPQKHYVLALAAIVQGSHDSARSQLQKVLEGWEPLLRENAKALLGAYTEYDGFPQSTEAHLETLLARGLAIVNECRLALPILSSVIGQLSSYRDAWTVRGFCEFSIEKFAEARNSLEQAYTLDPEKPEIQYFLGRTYLALNDLENAATFLQYAVRNGLRPEKDARKMLASVNEKMGNANEAYNQLKAVAEAEDAVRDDVIALGEFAVAQQRIPEFMETLKKAMAKWPEDAAIHLLMGRMALSQNDKVQAKAAFEKVLELDSGNVEARGELQKL